MGNNWDETDFDLSAVLIAGMLGVATDGRAQNYPEKGFEFVADTRPRFANNKVCFKSHDGLHAGSCAIRNDIFPVYWLLILGIIGYLMMKCDVPVSPAILTAVLMPLMETNFMQTLTISRGAMAIFVERPAALALLALCVAFLLLPPLIAVRQVWKRNRDLGANAPGNKEGVCFEQV